MWSCCRGASSALVFTLFFFQAEDGIRDLVRSRGLGDVYKRQEGSVAAGGDIGAACGTEVAKGAAIIGMPPFGPVSVSYTHLTLPTSDLV